MLIEIEIGEQNHLILDHNYPYNHHHHPDPSTLTTLSTHPTTLTTLTSPHHRFTVALKDSFESFINQRQNKPAEMIAKLVEQRLRVFLALNNYKQLYCSWHQK